MSQLQEDDHLERLIRRAAPRPPAPPEMRERVFEQVHAAWSGRKKPRGRVWILAAAAAVVLALITVRLAGWQALSTPTAELAHVERVVGTVDVQLGESIEAERWIDTASDGLVALELGTHSVRLAPYSRLRILSATTLELERGSVYLDSGDRVAHSPGIAVLTARGRVEELGTRFEVRVTPETLRVRVRGGRVAVGEAGRHAAGPGIELTLDASGEPSRREIPIHGPHWDWVLRAAACPSMDGRPLTELLRWVERETGLTIESLDAPTETRVLETVLHGSIEGLSPDEALAATLPPSGLTYSRESGRLWLEVSAGDATQ